MAADNMHLLADLGSRVQELTLLHDVTRILQRDDLLSASEWLDEIAKAIARSWPRHGAIAVRAGLAVFAAAFHAAVLKVGAPAVVRHVPAETVEAPVLGARHAIAAIR